MDVRQREAPAAVSARSWTGSSGAGACVFLAQCNDGAFERNVQQLVALGAYSHRALKDMVRSTGISTTGSSAVLHISIPTRNRLTMRPMPWN